jgi:pyruvate carboxylase
MENVLIKIQIISDFWIKGKLYVVFSINGILKNINVNAKMKQSELEMATV